MVGEDVPEGQGAVTELLAECFDLNYDLRLAAEAAAEVEKVQRASKPTTETESSKPPATDTEA